MHEIIKSNIRNVAALILRRPYGELSAVHEGTNHLTRMHRLYEYMRSRYRHAEGL